MRTLTDLANDLDKKAEQIPIAANAVKKRVATSIVEALVQSTPVDTGAAVSNWQASNEAPNLSSIPPYAPSPAGRMVKGTWTHAVEPSVTREANAPEIIAASEAVIVGSQPSEPIFIANNLPYIRVLDNGSSLQAPAGFVDRAKILARSVVDSARGLL